MPAKPKQSSPPSPKKSISLILAPDRDAKKAPKISLHVNLGHGMQSHTAAGGAFKSLAVFFLVAKAYALDGRRWMPRAAVRILEGRGKHPATSLELARSIHQNYLTKLFGTDYNQPETGFLAQLIHTDNPGFGRKSDPVTLSYNPAAFPIEDVRVFRDGNQQEILEPGELIETAHTLLGTEDKWPRPPQFDLEPSSPPAPAIRSAVSKPDDESLQAYLKNLRRQCLALPLTSLGDDDDHESALTLDDVYIDLETETPIVKVSHLGAPRTHGLRAIAEGEHESNRRLAAMRAAAQSARLVLLGEPGSGKSTFVQRLLARQASVQLGEIKKPLAGIPGDLLPVLITLRDLAPRLALLNMDGLSETARKETLSCLVLALAEHNLAGLKSAALAPQLRAAFEDGRLLLVLDGLDEVPHELQKAFRQTVAAALAQFRPERVIVTCRIRSYEGNARLPQFEAHTLAPFTDDQIGRFVKNWYAAQARNGRINSEQAGDKTDDLTRAALGGELRELAGNPMLLTTMALIHQREIRLPPQRVKLYTLAVDVLVRRWQKGKTGALAAFLDDTLKVRAALERLAFEAHCAGKGQKQAADLPRGTALTILEERKYLGSPGLAAEFLDYVDQRAGMLVGRGGEPDAGPGSEPRPPQLYSFPHRTFQEYLAGCHLLSGRDSGAQARAFYERAREGDYWSLAIKLAAEELCHNVPRATNQLLDLAYHLCPCRPPTSTQDRRAELWSANIAALLGSAVILEDHDAPDGGSNYLERLMPRLTGLLACDLPLIERAEAGRILGHIGDHRQGVGRRKKDGLPDIDFVPAEPLPAGKFKLGETSKTVEIKQPYRISRYPVTVTQFQAFEAAGGYDGKNPKAEIWWGKAGWDWKRKEKILGPEAGGQAFETPNHPRIGVSWYEATAFCVWLTEQLRAKGELKPDETIRLPHEAEWEQAARWNQKDGRADGRTFPWSDSEKDLAQRCNCHQTGLGSTSAVGLFPDGNSECGAADLSGNVWEWCENRYDDKEQYRVLRGGSWFNVNPERLSASYRHLSTPGFRDNGLGFRCVLVSGLVR